MLSDQIYSPACTYLISKIYEQIEKDILLITTSDNEAILASQQLNYFCQDRIAHFFPSWDVLAYDRISPRPEILSTRAKLLLEFANHDKRKIIVMSAHNFLQKLPPKEDFLQGQFVLKIGTQISRDQLVIILIDYGYTRCSEASYIGEFSAVGEIIDVIIATDEAYRINLAWDKVEAIKIIDSESKISKANKADLTLHPATEFYISPRNINRFKQGFLTSFGVNHTDHPIYEAVTSNRHYPAAESLLPLLYNELTPITDYLNKPLLIADQITKNAMQVAIEDINDLYDTRIATSKSLKSFDPILKPERLYLNGDVAERLVNQTQLNNYKTDIELTENIPNFFHQSKQSKQEVIKILDKFVSNYLKHKIIFCCSTISSAERIKNILEQAGTNLSNINDSTKAELGNILHHGLRNRHKIEIILLPMRYGFVGKDNIYISQFELFGEKASVHKQTQSKKLKNILSELESFNEGELIVHEEHGIGQFLGVENVRVGKISYDCVKLLYAGNDKIYIPVGNIDTIKKYGNEAGQLDKLGGVSWQKRKAKLKDRIGELAGKLLKISAQRQMQQTEPYLLSDDYQKFVRKFSYAETEDQLRAIEDIENDLTEGKLMDRLICGDVGFGKTEVAMRAAYLTASNGKQVAVIVPTTILARQHYINFLARFHGSGLCIKQISRLVKNGEITKIKEGLKNGDIDIIVGTHALLAQNIEFDNLGMMILDEEQHFGVTQKERLKELQTNIHVLAMSATPIPRTLQMGLLGIRDLSLIATPPIDRMSIRTALIQNDPVIIRDALMREYLRGGKSFYVAPRISDLEDVANMLREIVPELKFRIAHGQMPATGIEEIMDEFDEGKFDILLSTTIVESGIDMPSANTIIIHRADMLGLSQLYQLRGRIGRSKVRGYAYLVIDNRNISKHSQKRLEIMQNIDSLGAGFSIASYDMDIRGFGNLVGDEQSGNIKEVGIELYQEMLAEEIIKLKGDEQNRDHFSTDINLGISFSLPESYIDDSQLRLKLYKRISNLELDEIDIFEDELVDRFGPIPKEVKNLLSIVFIKQLCRNLHIIKLDVGPGGMVIKFHKNYDASSIVLTMISKYPRNSKMKPDGSFVFIQQTNQDNVIAETTKMLTLIEEASATQNHPT